MCAFVLAACQPGITPEEVDAGCSGEITPIAGIQGSGPVSLLSGSEASIRGIVTQVTPGLGFSLEEPGSDDSPATSNGIYVEDETLSLAVKPSQQWKLTGLISELGQEPDTVTALSVISAQQLCATGLKLPRTPLNLPLGPQHREAIENMRVSFTGPLIVTDVYNYYRGQVMLSLDQPLRIPTEDEQPGEAAQTLGRNNRERSIRTAFGQSDNDFLRSGSGIDEVAGVIGHDSRGQLFLLDQIPQTHSAPAAQIPAAHPGTIRVVSMNLLNFFNGDGAGNGFPTERGAKTHDDFLHQAARIQSALTQMQPSLIAVQELENDGFGPDSAAQSLIDLLEAAVPADWAIVKSAENRQGTDVISVGLFYRSDLLQAVDPPSTLDSAPFQDLSRQPLAQRFRERASGAEFLVAVNHFKSKGSCPPGGDNANQRDGQGCWNKARVEAAEAVIEWMNQLTKASSVNNVLILGDFNSYRNEDPVLTFRQSAYVEAVEHRSGLPQYSYVYAGEAGTLDYAFVSRSLMDFMQHAEIWHINADWPQKTKLPHLWMRFSDHDPLLVDLDFIQASTSD